MASEPIEKSDLLYVGFHLASDATKYFNIEKKILFLELMVINIKILQSILSINYEDLDSQSAVS